MVAQTVKELDKAGVEAGDHQKVLIVASIVEGEASVDDDRGKVARVIENRLETKSAPTYGLIQIDSTVYYGARSAARCSRARPSSTTRATPTTPASTRDCRPARSATPGRRRSRPPPTRPPAPGSSSSRSTRHRRDQVRHDAGRAQRQRRGAPRLVRRQTPGVRSVRAAVLGSPIAHSLSPVLHRAGYAAAGLSAVGVRRPRGRRGRAAPGSSAASTHVAWAVADHAAQGGGLRGGDHGLRGREARRRGQHPGAPRRRRLGRQQHRRRRPGPGPVTTPRGRHGTRPRAGSRGHGTLGRAGPGRARRHHAHRAGPGHEPRRRPPGLGARPGCRHPQRLGRGTGAVAHHRRRRGRRRPCRGRRARSRPPPCRPRTRACCSTSSTPGGRRHSPAPVPLPA